MSNPGHVPAVLHYLVGLEPKAVLDVGVGLGTYGFLTRQFLDVSKARLAPSEWQTRIDGIEIFEPYRNPVWEHFYDSVTICDIRGRVATLAPYDVILCNDVLEHFEQDEARALIVALLDRCRVLIATTPAIDFPQGAWGNNEAEAHHCLLTRQDFPPSTQAHRTGVTNLFVSWSDPTVGKDIVRLGQSMPRISYCTDGLPARMRRRLGQVMRIARG